MFVETLLRELEGMLARGDIEKSSQVFLDVYGRGGIYVMPLMTNRVYTDKAGNLHFDAVDV
jgi:hypothetical protein